MHSLLRVTAIAAAHPNPAALSLRRTTSRLCSAAAIHSDGAERRWPRPSTIPFQAKVANSVNLIGRIHAPVQLKSSPDGKFWAATVITHDQPSKSQSSPLWIPVIFKGDLAHIAAFHLKENDRICIEGQFSSSPQTADVSPGQCNAQVLVHSINFVDGSAHPKPIAGFSKFEKPAASKQDTKRQVEDSWRNLLNIPEDWSDYRKAKLDGLVSQKYPDFKRKDKTASLWLDSAPQWVLPNIQGLEFGGNNDLKLSKEDKGDEAWKDLVANLEIVGPKPTYPDFRHKDTRQGLWLSSSPSWVLSKLPPSKQPDETSNWMKAAPKSAIDA